MVSEFTYELLLLGIAPAIFLLWYFRHKERFTPKEPIGLMLKTFLRGAFWIIPALILELAGQYFLQPDPHSLVQSILFFYIVVGPAEELGKYWAVTRSARSPKFRVPFDGIILGVSAGLGFATVENILYIFNAPTPEDQVLTGIIRALLSVPGHAFWGAIIGFYVGQSRRFNRAISSVAGLAIAAFLHGTFDSANVIVSEFAGDSTALNLLGLAVLFGIVYLGYVTIVRKEIRTAEAESDHATMTP